MSAHPERVARIEGKFHADPRLIAGAMAIVTHVARRAGFADSAASELATAATEACNAFAQLLKQSVHSLSDIQLAASEFADHVEVTVNLAGSRTPAPSAPTAEQNRAVADHLRRKLTSAPVDAVNVEVEGGYPQITLIKNCRAAKRRFEL